MNEERQKTVGRVRWSARGWLQRFAVVALFFLMLGLFITGMGRAAPLTSMSIDDEQQLQLQRSHANGSPCPESEENGYPCGAACACACCPGHAVSPMLFALQSSELDPSASDELKLPFSDSLHPKDVHVRIFHPPRA